MIFVTNVPRNNHFSNRPTILEKQARENKCTVLEKLASENKYQVPEKLTRGNLYRTNQAYSAKFTQWTTEMIRNALNSSWQKKCNGQSSSERARLARSCHIYHAIASCDLKHFTHKESEILSSTHYSYTNLEWESRKLEDSSSCVCKREKKRAVPESEISDEYQMER